MTRNILKSLKDKSKKTLIIFLIMQITILSIIQHLSTFYVYAETKEIIPPDGVIGDVFVIEAWNREAMGPGKGWKEGTNQRALYDKYYLPNKEAAFDEHGLGVINGYYVVATGQAFGKAGDRVDFIYESGITFECIMGDEKGIEGNEGNYAEYADMNGRNVIEFMVDYYSSRYYEGGGQNDNPGTWCFPDWKGQHNEKLLKVINYGPYDGFSQSSQSHGSSVRAYDIDAEYVDLDVREFKFSGLPKTVSYEGYTNPIANLFKNLGRLLDLLMGLLINGLKRVIIGWTRIIEIMINYVFYKTEQTIVEAPGNETGE